MSAVSTNGIYSQILHDIITQIITTTTTIITICNNSNKSLNSKTYTPEQSQWALWGIGGHMRVVGARPAETCSRHSANRSE